MSDVAVLQFSNGEPEVNLSAANYAALIPQWGLPATHTQLLQELKAWLAASDAFRHQPIAALQRALEVEGDILMDVSVAGTAAEHIPFLYTVLGEVFDEFGAQFRKRLQQEAVLAEQAYEADIHQQMDDTGVDRLEAVYSMESVTLQRLQERQERLMLLVEGLEEQDTQSLTQ
jgi:hypothetical protein